VILEGVISVVLALLVQDTLPFEKDPWDGFKVGSWVKLQTTRVGGGEDIKYTLEEIKPLHKKIVSDPAPPVEEGKDDPSIVKFTPYSKQIEKWELQQSGKGTETLKFGVKARVAEYEGSSIRLRVSFSDQVPGGIAKVIYEAAGDKPQKAALELDGQEKLKIAGKDVPCVRFRYDYSAGKESKSESMYWLSGEMPGLLVRFRAKTTTGKLVTETGVEAVEFEKK